MLAVFILLIKFSKIVFVVWNFVLSLNFYYKNNFCPSCMLSKSIETDFSTLHWIAESEKIRYVYSREIFLCTATIREVNSTVKLSQILRREKDRITRHYGAKLQTTKQTFTTTKHAIEFTYSDFPCHFKVNRDKLALTNRWMCKRMQKIDDYR